MARKVFYSFDFKGDSFRVSQIKQMGALEGQPILNSNEWEKVKGGGANAIQAWIDKQMYGKSCVVVLIGSGTAGRRWVNYEIEKGWNDKRGLVGVHIHNLRDGSQMQSSKGANPFAGFSVAGRSLSSIVKAYDPPGLDSKSVHAHIKNNLAAWVEEAIETRKRVG